MSAPGHIPTQHSPGSGSPYFRADTSFLSTGQTPAGQGGSAPGITGTSGISVDNAPSAGIGQQGGLAGLADLVGKVLSDGRIDEGDVGAIGSAALGFLGINVDAGAAAGRTPLGMLLEFVVSRIDFLADPLAKLLGSAELVQEQSQSWTRIATTFEEAGRDHGAGSQDLRAWTGPAAAQYAQVQAATSTIFPAAAQGGKSMAVAVVKAGEMVAEVRAFIWEVLARFIQQTVQAALSALASAAPTFGASITAFSAWFIGSTASLAQQFATLLRNLLKKAAAFGAMMKEETAKLDQAAKLLKDFSATLAGTHRRGASAARGGGISSPLAANP